ELANLDDQRLVAGVLADRDDALAAEDKSAVSRRAVADAAKRADAAVLPHAGGDVGVLRVRARHALAAGAHDRVQRLDAVDAVPEKIRVMRLEAARAVHIAATHAAEFRVLAQLEDARTEAQR